MTAGRPLAAAVLGLLIVAAALGLRLFRITEFSLHPDETYSYDEIVFAAADPYRHYRVMPLGLAPIHTTTSLLGSGHLGLRLGPALCGVLAVLATLVLGWRAFGARFGLIASALVAFAPWHIHFSQYARFYAPAFLYMSVGLFALIIGLAERRRGWLILAAAMLAATVYGHTYGLFALAAAVGFVFVVGMVPRLRPRTWRVGDVWLVTLLTGALLIPLAIVLLQVIPRWAGANVWRYSPAHTILGLLNNLTPPLLAAGFVGLLAALHRPDWRGRLLATVALVPALLVVGASAHVSARHDYYFTAAIGAFALAAYGIDHYAGRHRVAAAVATVALIGLQLPWLVSYYQTGNRFDYRRAFAHIESQWRPGDVVVTEVPGLARHYGAADRRVIQWRVFLERPVRPAGRAWLIATVGRRGPIEQRIGEWLHTHARLAWQYAPNRFDYFDHRTQVWLWPSPP